MAETGGPHWLDALYAACAPVLHLCYADVTDGHAVAGALDGRAIHPDGRDVQLLIVSETFEGKTPLERQGVVNGVLHPYIVQGLLHSVQMRCWTSAQWERMGRPAHLGTPCSVTTELLGTGVGKVNLLPCTAEVPERASVDVLADRDAATSENRAGADGIPTGPSVAALVEHLSSQGIEQSLECARQILLCTCASPNAKAAATVIVARGTAAGHR
jgi:acid stress-induced BolA-like protein IbaG/YrbA